MILISLKSREEYNYLMKVFSTYLSGGVQPPELFIAGDLYHSMMTAKEIDMENNLGTAARAEITPNGVALEFEQDGGPQMPDGS